MQISKWQKEKRLLHDGIATTIGNAANPQFMEMSVILGILPVIATKHIALFRVNNGESRTGYLFGSLSLAAAVLRAKAAEIEQRCSYPILTIHDIFPLEWVERLRVLAPEDEAFATVFKQFLRRGIITDIFLCGGWEDLPCVPALVKVARDEGLTENHCQETID